MTKLKNLIKTASTAVKSSINWHPGHMYSGMQAMIGKLRTVDCIIEVHDARIPFTGRNVEFRRQLGTIKPHLLVLNKCDLADLTGWKSIHDRLTKRGDQNVLLSDLSGNNTTEYQKNYTKIIDKAMSVIGQSERYNREGEKNFKLMVVGIPNCGKSTLINRLRQHHLGRKGEATKTGPTAGVTRQVEFMIKVCSRPSIYILDTPGILEPGATRNVDQAMRLALCSSINDRVLKPEQLASYLLNFLNNQQNFFYLEVMNLEKPILSTPELVARLKEIRVRQDPNASATDNDELLWQFIRNFRKGHFGQVMFD